MSSKLKDLANSFDSSSVNKITSNGQAVTAAEDVEIFNNVMDVTHNASMDLDKQNEQNQQELKKDDDGQVKSADAASGAEKAKPRKTKKEEEHELSEEEAKAIEEQRVNVEELARQLQVVLKPEEQVSIQQQALDQAKEVLNQQAVAAAQTEEVVKEIDPELLKKVDVQTLRDKLDGIIQKDGDLLLQTEVPKEIPKEVLNNQENKNAETPLDQLLDNVANQKIQEEAVSEVLEKVVTEAFENNLDVKAMADGSTPDQEEKLDIFSQRLLDGTLEDLDQVLPLINENGPDVVLNVVSATVDHRTVNEALQTSDKLYPLVDLLGENEDLLAQESIMDFVVDSLQTMESQDLAQPQSESKFSALNLLSSNKFTQSLMKPVYQKVTTVVMHMARQGQSGITRIQIHPPELGSVNIKFVVTEDRVSAEIITENQATKELLKEYLPQIEEMMASENLKVEGLDIKHDKDYFNKPQQKMVTDFALNEHEKQNAEEGSNREAAREELHERLQMLIAERRSRHSFKKINFSI